MCWHKWSKWSIMVVAYSGTKQFKSCVKCNKVKLRSVSCSNNTEVSVWNTDKLQEQPS